MHELTETLPELLGTVLYHKPYCFTLNLQVVQYNYRPHERDPHDLSWVDTSIDAVLNRIYVKLSASFLANVLVSFSYIVVMYAVIN